MRRSASPAVLAELRRRVAQLGRGRAAPRPALPFGLAAIDAALPRGGLARGALHEIGGGGDGAVDGAAAALFAAGIAARTRGPVLWCVTRADLFAPALSQGGLGPARVIHVEAGDERTLLACFEEGLRQEGLGAVVGEVARLPMTAARRLHLAAEASGGLGLAIRRWRRAAEADAFGAPTAAVTRWRVSARPSAPLPVPGLGRARWHLELLRVRGGEGAAFDVEACDGKGRLALPAELAHGSGQTDLGEQGAGARRAAR